MLGNVSEVNQKEAIAALQRALKENDDEKAKLAWQKFHESIVDSVMQDSVEYSRFGDMSVLAQRGYRQLTEKETKFYQKLIEIGKSANPKQSFTELMDVDGGMPETIIQDVYRDLIEKHPLLSRINFQNVKYLTKWILSDHTKQTAAWGEINSEIAQEITSSFKVVDVMLCKLSAFAVIQKDMLDLGPEYLDNYIRTILREALYVALEREILKGNGVNGPIGLNRDIHKGVAVSTTDGYPEKQAISVKSFLPEEYGNIVANLAVSESGRMRSFDQVTLVCNMVDYLKKVMPATTVLNSAGQYATNLFPFPTEIIRSNELDTGEAILFLSEEYFMGIGENKDGTIEYSDEYKFLEDQRVFKIKLHGNGRAFDNTVAVVLDISNLDPAYITVLAKGTELTA